MTNALYVILGSLYYDSEEGRSDCVCFVWLQSSGDESAVLWLDQIQEAIHTANQDEEEAGICTYTRGPLHSVSPSNTSYYITVPPSPLPTSFSESDALYVRVSLFHIFIIDWTTFWTPCLVPVAGAVANINRAVAEGDSQSTLQALQAPDAGLRGVLSECADTYQAQLAQRQTDNTTTGNPVCMDSPHNKPRCERES